MGQAGIIYIRVDGPEPLMTMSIMTEIMMKEIRSFQKDTLISIEKGTLQWLSYHFLPKIFLVMGSCTKQTKNNSAGQPIQVCVQSVAVAPHQAKLSHDRKHKKAVLLVLIFTFSQWWKNHTDQL